MNHQHVYSKETAFALSTMFLVFSYTYYYIHMTLLDVLGSSPEMMTALAGMIWLKRALFVANILTIVFCVYALINNKELSVWWMERMPARMLDWMERMPGWMSRWMNHTAMRVMMIGMDVMLVWMSVEFGLYTYKHYGW